MLLKCIKNEKRKIYLTIEREDRAVCYYMTAVFAIPLEWNQAKPLRRVCMVHGYLLIIGVTEDPIKLKKKLFDSLYSLGEAICFSVLYRWVLYSHVECPIHTLFFTMFSRHRYPITSVNRFAWLHFAWILKRKHAPGPYWPIFITTARDDESLLGEKKNMYVVLNIRSERSVGHSSTSVVRAILLGATDLILTRER